MQPFVLIDDQLINHQFIVKAFVGPDGYVRLGLMDGSTVVTKLETLEEYIFTYRAWSANMLTDVAKTAEEIFEGLQDLDRS